MARASVVRIGDMAEMIGRDVATLRRWDREGVFRAQRDSSGGRFYSPDDVLALRRIAEERAAKAPRRLSP